MSDKGTLFADVYPCAGKCPYGVRCAPGCCFEQGRIDSERLRESRRSVTGSLPGRVCVTDGTE